MARFNHPADSTLIPVAQLYPAVNEPYPSGYQLTASLVRPANATAIPRAPAGKGGY